MTHHISNNEENTLNIISDDVVDLQSLITTNTNNIISNQAQINTLNANQLFTDCIKFKINGAYEYTGLTNNGVAKSITNPLTTTARRFILLREDTYDNAVVLSNANTTFTPNESGYYLSLISAEIYDNSATSKSIQLYLYGHTEGASLQVVRHLFTGSSTIFEYAKVSDSQVVYLTAGNQYFYKAQSSNGGVINAYTSTTNFTLIKMGKSF